MKTASDFVDMMTREHTREQRLREHTHRESMVMARRMCNAGLIDDIEPDGGIIVPIPPAVCGGCGMDCPEKYGPMGPCPCGVNSWRL